MSSTIDRIDAKVASGELPMVADMVSALIEHSAKLETANERLVAAARAYGPAEHSLRMAKARAAMRADVELEKRGVKPTETTRRAYIQLATEKESQRLGDGSEALMLAYREVARGQRGVLSAWQSISSAFRSELDFARTAP